MSHIKYTFTVMSEVCPNEQLTTKTVSVSDQSCPHLKDHCVYINCEFS